MAVVVRVGSATVNAVIRDDGCGFDVDDTLPSAARRGSMGLLGMVERIRHLDGVCDFEGGRGVGTTVRLSFGRLFPETAHAPEPESDCSATSYLAAAG